MIIFSLLATLLSLIFVPPCAAHPLDESGVGHLAVIEIQNGSFQATLTWYFSPLTAFTHRRMADETEDNTLSDEELRQYGRDLWESEKHNIVFQRAGAAIPTMFVSSDFQINSRQSDLPEAFSLTCVIRLPETYDPKTEYNISYTDTTFIELPCWVVVMAKETTKQFLISQPIDPAWLDSQGAIDPVKMFALTEKFPTARNNLIIVNPSATKSAVTVSDAGKSKPAQRNPAGERLSGFLTSGNQGIGFMISAALIAVLLGCMHALSPGHGKSLVAAYMVAIQGTLLDAFFLGIVITISHTFFVFLVGFLALGITHFFVPEQVLLILSLFSGVCIIVIGIWGLLQRINHYRRVKLAGTNGHPSLPVTHSHTSDHSHDHSHEHSHDHPHPHSHKAERDHSDEHEAQLPPTHTHEHPHIHSHQTAHEHPEGHPDSKPIPYYVHSHNHEHDDSHHHDASHDHVHHHDDHHHHSGWGHHHHELVSIPKNKLQFYGQLISLGIFGGMMPCPSALVVLLTAISLNRIAFGLLLISAFSLGLASVLIVLGIAVQGAVKQVRRLDPSGLKLAMLPIVSSVLIVLLGVYLVASSIKDVLR